MVPNSSALYNSESESCMLQSIAKVFEFCDYYLKKLSRDWISGCMKVNFKDKILKFSWYNGIKVSFPVGSMCKYSLNSY